MTGLHEAILGGAPLILAVAADAAGKYAPSQTGVDFLQYGALGLCAIMIGWNCYKDWRKLSADAARDEAHRKEREELVNSIRAELVVREKLLNAMFSIVTRVCTTFHERPCLLSAAAFDPERIDGINLAEILKKIQQKKESE